MTSAPHAPQHAHTRGHAPRPSGERVAHTEQEESGNIDEESLEENRMDPRNSQGLEGRKTCQGYNRSGKGGSEVPRLAKATRKVCRGLRPLSQPLTFSPRFHGGGWACPASVCVPRSPRPHPRRAQGLRPPLRANTRTPVEGAPLGGTDVLPAVLAAPTLPTRQPEAPEAG